jgi:hypothetical protein
MYCVERSMTRRILAGCVVIFSIAIVPVEAFGLTAGRGGHAVSISSGLRGSTFRPALHAAPRSRPLLFNRRRSAFGVPPRSPFGFGFPLFPFDYGFPFGPFGFGFPPGPYDYGVPPTQFDLGAPAAFSGCASFYCTYYDPSEETYVDPYNRPWSSAPSTILGLVKPAFISRQGCDSEAVKVHSEGGEERTVNVVRC